jgi:hypothetical protein
LETLVLFFPLTTCVQLAVLADVEFVAFRTESFGTESVGIGMGIVVWPLDVETSGTSRVGGFEGFYT